MKKTSFLRPARRTGYTLIELLVVIAVIALLASLLLPAISGAKKKTLIKKARVEMADIRNAVTTYLSDYNGRMPVIPAAGGAGVPDFTHWDGSLVTGQTAYNSLNSEAIAILADVLRFRDGTSTVNNMPGPHSRNPKQNRYLNAKESNGNATNPVPGVGEDGVYRDPWGKPYFITFDVNYDGVCHDALYRRQVVAYDTANSRALKGLVQTGAANSDNWGTRGEVLIWSAGPDGQYDIGINANVGVNEDNILSWWDQK